MPWLTDRARVHDLPPDAPLPFAMTRGAGMWVEAGGALEWVRLLARWPALDAVPRGSQRPTVLVPGFQSPEVALSPLGWWLRRMGHDARSWGRGTNRGHVDKDVAGMLPVVRQLAEEAGRPIALVGWSLGGVISRELAREAPESVDRVVTFGTPVVGGPSFTLAASVYGPELCDKAAARSARRERDRPLTLPITAIFTRLDGIVSWPACIDRLSPEVRHVEVASRHISMGIDPDVWRVIAEALADEVPAEAPAVSR